jgi:hypothetical protein
MMGVLYLFCRLLICMQVFFFFFFFFGTWPFLNTKNQGLVYSFYRGQHVMRVAHQAMNWATLIDRVLDNANKRVLYAMWTKASSFCRAIYRP